MPTYAHLLNDPQYLAREEARAQAHEALGRELRAALDTQAWAQPGFAQARADLLQRGGLINAVPQVLNGWRLAYVSGPGAEGMRLEAALEEAATHWGRRSPAAIRANAEESLRMARLEAGITPGYVPDSHRVQAPPPTPPGVVVVPTASSTTPVNSTQAASTSVPVVIATPSAITSVTAPIGVVGTATILPPGALVAPTSGWPSPVPVGAQSLTASGGGDAGQPGLLDQELIPGVANKWLLLAIAAAGGLLLWGRS